MDLERIIYFYRIQAAASPNWQERLRQLLRQPYPLQCREGELLGYPLCAYGIVCSQPWEEAAADGRHPETTVQDIDRRRKRTMKRLRQLLTVKEKQDMTYTSEKTFLCAQWEECRIPGGLMLPLYQSYRQQEPGVKAAEQLILLDGTGEEALWDMEGAREVAFAGAILGTFNDMTVVTDRPGEWQQLTEDAYEEYGLLIHCTGDDKGLHFRKKPTLILDLQAEARACWAALPPESVYLDFWESRKKRELLRAACRPVQNGEIPVLSLQYTLDTLLKDTV